jgi:amidase
VPLWPEVAEGWGSMAVEGVVSRSVRDTAVILDVAAGPCPGDLHTPPLPRRPYRKEVGADPGRLRIGLPTTAPDPSIATHPECVAAAKGVARLLESLGHTVEPEYPPALADHDISQAFLPCYGTWTALHLDWWASCLVGPSRPRTWSRRPGRWRSWAARSAAPSSSPPPCMRCTSPQRGVQRWWAQGWDVLVTPTIAEPPPPLGEYAAQPDNPLWPITRAVVEVAYTISFNMTGQPAISLPLHWTADVLPVGVQLVAAYGREDLLVRVAAQLEQVRPWTDRRPRVHA